MQCPKCGYTRVHRSRTRSTTERLLKWLGVKPFRCHNCNTRFRLFVPRWRQPR